jgi:starch synthase
VEERLRILFVSAEVSPFARTGGLGDVVSALPPVLTAHGLDVRIVMPLYEAVRRHGVPLTLVCNDLRVPLSFGERTAQVWQGNLPGDSSGQSVPVYFIEQDDYFARTGLYGDDVGEYGDNPFRFTFFCRAALALAERLAWFPHVIHCHDWHTGLIPAYLRFPLGLDSRLASAATVFTIHNLAYQGVFPAVTFNQTGLPPQLFQPAGVEFYGNVNFMKAGLYYADFLTTVSPTYAEEICTPEYGYGLDGVLRERRQALVGIVNGADYDLWNPATDPALVANYSLDDLTGKARCKLALLRTFGMLEDLDLPVFGMVTRFADQKGIDLVAEALERLFVLNGSVVMLGSGERRYEELFLTLGRRYPDRLGVRLGFNDELSHQIQAGSDFLLMPSRFEPCGLTQMYAMRYGTVPIVRMTGGLRDTVSQFDLATRQGTGFVFSESTADALLSAATAAVSVFNDNEAWRQLQRNAMAQDFSWDRSALRYIELYQQAVALKSGEDRGVA